MRGTYFKLIAFFGVCGLTTAFLMSLLSETSVTGTQNEYHALVTDASLLKQGDAVRIAGVDVGNVQKLTYLRDETVRIDFSVKQSVQLPRDVRAAIRYKNLIGDRVLILSRPSEASSGPLPQGGTIPASRTDPALNLDALTGGFKPLLQALDPDAVNKLSANLLALVQGEDGSVGDTVRAVTDIAGVIAAHGSEVEQVISNLDAVMATTAAHSDDLGILVDLLQRLVARANAEKAPILDAVHHVSEFSDVLGDLLKEARPSIAGTIAAARSTAATLNQNQKLVTDFLRGWGPAYETAAGIGVYGDFFNFFLCDVRVKVTGANGKPLYTPWINSHDARCAYPNRSSQ